jgi:lipid A 4'-phosphatase
MRLPAARPIFLLCHPAVWIPAVVLAIATVLFWTTDLDQASVWQFFSRDSAASADVGVRFPLGTHQPWKLLYDCGVYPALLLGCGGFVVWIVSFFWQKIASWRDPGLFFALVLIIGPGILVNCVLKPYWSRPRPHATKTFKSSDDPRDPPRDFVPVWWRGLGEEDSSFPSGHAAMGFYLMAPAFVFYRRRRWLAAGFLLFGLASGTTIGLARVVAGCHFPSDVLWAGGIVYFTALALAAPFRFGCAIENNSAKIAGS